MPGQDYRQEIAPHCNDTIAPMRTAELFVGAWGDDTEAMLCTYIAGARPSEIARWLQTIRALVKLRIDRSHIDTIAPMRTAELFRRSPCNCVEAADPPALPDSRPLEIARRLETVLALLKLSPSRSCDDTIRPIEIARLFVLAWGNRAEAFICFYLANAQPSEVDEWLKAIRALVELRSHRQDQLQGPDAKRVIKPLSRPRRGERNPAS